MEQITGNDEERFTSANQCDDKTVSLNNNHYRSNKNRFHSKPKPVNMYKPRTCSYFYNKGYCKFGDSCKYKHFNKESNDKCFNKEQSTTMTNNVLKSNIREKKDSLQDLKAETTSKHRVAGSTFNKKNNAENLPSHNSYSNETNFSAISVPQKSQNNKQPRKWNRPRCYYYKRGSCFKGDNCKFYHGGNILSKSATNVLDHQEENRLLFPVDKDNENNVKEENCSTAKVPNFSCKSLNKHDLSSLTLEAAHDLRITEINQLKKRFPRCEIVEENHTFSFMFQPSDPDWAFDVKSLKLEVNFPEKYPTEKCKITVIQNAENIPGLLIKFLNKAIYDWVDKKFEENNAANKIELMFRIFLKWFDKNLEDLFIAGLKKVKQDLKAKEDGIEFVPVENLFSSARTNTSEESPDENVAPINTSPLQEQTPVSLDENSQPLENKSNKLSYSGENNGLKVIFSALELTEGAAALICTKISVTLQCYRCRTSFNATSTPKRNNSHVCSKCSKTIGFTFDPSTVHQFSSVLGYLHLVDCVAVDINLIECFFLVDCLNCSKQVPVDGIHYGQKHKMWCTFCNEKMMVSIGGTKFQAAKLSSLPDAKYLPTKRLEKKVKDPVVKEGEPLPNFGACKHYKKSFRWLRFPCCGRLYPCDVCHDEKETDHEMKYASRMICGFCAKEQPYSREKPCFVCSQNLTKKSGSHWEGGKGCRNKIQMSREDKQKYSGVCKTVSKKAQTTKLKKKH